jgi:hypothetical protein
MGGAHVGQTGRQASLATAVGLLAIAALAGWSLFYPPPTIPARIAIAAAASENADHVAQIDAADGGRDAVAPLLLRRLDHLMTVERVYRQEGLTIGGLATKLDLPEYRLRQVINEGLGYRNFNAFLNRYRLDEAKAALSDLSQRDVPVLTVDRRRISIDRAVQSRLQGGNRPDPNRIPPRRPRPTTIRSVGKRRKFQNRPIRLKIG